MTIGLLVKSIGYIGYKFFCYLKSLSVLQRCMSERESAGVEGGR